MPTPLENYVKECGGKLNPAMNHTGTDYKGTYKLGSGDFTNGKLDFTVLEHNGEKIGWETASLEIKDGVFYLSIYDVPDGVHVNSTDYNKYVKQ